MQRNTVLVRQKYLEYLGSTMGFILSLYLANIADGIVVSQLLGTAAFAAINLTLPVYHLRNILFFFFVDGGSVLAAQFIGSRDKASCDQVFTISLGIGTLAMAVLGLAGWFTAASLAELLAGGSSLTGLTYDYLRPLWLTGPLLMLVNGMSSFLRLEGEHKLAIAMPVVANVCNLVFDYVFIAEFGWGMAGAGWATGAGYACSLLLMFPYWRRQERSWHFVPLKSLPRPLYRRSFLVGLPLALIPLGLVLRNLAMNSLALDKLGDIGAVTISLCNAALLYAMMFADGASITLGNVCGALYGEMDKRGAVQVLGLAMRLTLGASLLIMAFIMGCPEMFGSWYGLTGEAMSPEIILYLRISALYMLLLAPVFILRAFYQATRREHIATVFSLGEGVLLVIPLLYGLAEIDVALMWGAPTVAAMLALGGLFLYVKKCVQAGGLDNLLLLPTSDDRNVWEATINATVEAATQAVLAVESFCDQQGKLDSRQSYAAQLTVEELCVNIAEHGNLGDKGSIDIFVRIIGNGIVVKVRDMGTPFNPVKFLDEQGEEFSGLLMVRKLTTNIEYARILGFNTTIVTIGKLAA